MAKPRIDTLTAGQVVELAFCNGSGHTLYTEQCRFHGIEGEGEDREAVFSTLNPVVSRLAGPKGFVFWNAYREQRRWVCGTSAQRLRLVRVVED